MTVPLACYGVVKSRGTVPALIALATRSRYTHAVLYVGRVHGVESVVEAQASGAVISPLAKYAARTDVAWNDEEPLPVRYAVATAALAMVGTPYNFADIVALGLESLGVRSSRLRRRVDAGTALICSQLVTRAYRLGGYDLFGDKPDAEITPADLADRITRRDWERA